MPKLRFSMFAAFAVAGVAIIVMIQKQSKLGEENRFLRQQVDQLAQLQAENDHLSNLLAQVAEGIHEEVGRIKLQRIGGDWKLAGPVKDGAAADTK